MALEELLRHRLRHRLAQVGELRCQGKALGVREHYGKDLP
jgi:hypothetical protein